MHSVVLLVMIILTGPKGLREFVNGMPTNWNELISSNENEVGDIWAVLVAGSNGWLNYRHQADVCHAYQVLHSHGVPDEHIIVMMYDDIANNVLNPTPGIIINQPNGSDVYGGVVKDYTGYDVSIDNFIDVLTGKKTKAGTGKILQSGSNDNVFVYYADHGAVGLLSFPLYTYLYASQLNETIYEMYENGMYGKLVFYVEACESGSLFDGILPDNINVYATTAANPNESSYGCYFDPYRNVYLGDVYSCNWMEDSDNEVISSEELEKQWFLTKARTNTSHVMQYGDLSINKLDVSKFQGRLNISLTQIKSGILDKSDAVPSPEIPIEILKRKQDMVDTNEEKFRIQKEINNIEKSRQTLHDTVETIVAEIVGEGAIFESVMTEHRKLRDFKCHQATVETFLNHCVNLNLDDYILRYVYVFVNMCEYGYSEDKIIAAAIITCKKASAIPERV